MHAAVIARAFAGVPFSLTGSAHAQIVGDECSNPRHIFSFGGHRATIAQTASPLPVGCVPGGMSDDLWYCWRSRVDGPIRIRSSSAGSDVACAVYEGCECPEANSEIACGVGDSDNGFDLFFMAKAGASYLIRVGGVAPTPFGGAQFIVEYGLLHRVYDPVGDRTYTHVAIPDVLDWDGVRDLAATLGGHLATIADARENELVRSVCSNYAVTIGLTDQEAEGDFRWDNGEPFVYSNWEVGEPSEVKGSHDFVYIHSVTGRWRTWPEDTTHFVVEQAGPPACSADFDANGTVNSDDFLDFLRAFFARDADGDYNLDAVVNSQDFFDFLVAFFGGC